MRFSLSSLAILAVAVGHAAADSTERPSLNPPLSSIRHVDFANLPAAAKPATNAKRLAQGLPPMKPRSRKHRRASDETSLKRGTHVASAPRAEISPIVPLRKSCNILVKSATTTYGYLYKSFNDIGEYGQFQPNQADALVVSLSYVVGSSASVDMTATNGRSAAYPYVGAFSSFGNLGSSSNDLSPGSSNFGFVGATKQTPAGSPPVVGDTAFSEATGMPADYESAIWIYDPLTNVINAQWINTDGSAPETYLVYTRDADADLILMTGDPVAMRRDYAGDYPELTFTCVPSLA